MLDETVRRQILAIRNTGLTNMFDTAYVQRLAYERNYFELVVFIEENKRDYCKFILYGDRKEQGND